MCVLSHLPPCCCIVRGCSQRRALFLSPSGLQGFKVHVLEIVLIANHDRIVNFPDLGTIGCALRKTDALKACVGQVFSEA